MMNKTLAQEVQRAIEYGKADAEYFSTFETVYTDDNYLDDIEDDDFDEEDYM